MTPEQIDKEAERIREEYAYMDDLSLNGWMWEMIRRTSQYQQNVNKIDALVKPLPKDRTSGTHSALVRHVSDIKDMKIELYEEDPREYSGDLHILISIDSDTCLPVPRYEFKYNEFETNQGPHIIGFSEIRAFPHKFLKLISEFPYPTSEENNYPIPKLLSILSPHDPDDIIYICFSKHGQKEVILRSMNKMLDHFLEPIDNRKRLDRWKNYIIVYDLMGENDGPDKYVTIAKIFDKAFPKVKGGKHTKGGIKTWHDQAKLLIRGNEYKKYLTVQK